MIRRLVVLLVFLALPLALLVDGCAAIVGLDESYPLADGGEGGATHPDASVADGGASDATSDTSVGEGDGSSGHGDDGGGAATDSGSPFGWRFDDTFGEGGVVVLGFSTYPPVIAVDDGGTVSVVYTDGSENLHLCQGRPLLSVDGCPPIPSEQGYPVELLTTAGATVLVANTGSSATTPAPVHVLTVAGDLLTYQPSGNCVAARGIAIDDSGTVSVAASCAGGYELLQFEASGSTSVAATYHPPGTGGLFTSAVGGEGSDVWAVGCENCSAPLSEASYLHVTADGGTLATGATGSGSHTFIGSDLLPERDGGLLVGSYSVEGVGIFTVSVPAVSDGGATLSPTLFDLAGLALEPPTSGRLAITRAAPGINVIVGAISSLADLAVLTVDDQGAIEPPWPATTQLLPFTYPGVANIVIGGVVAYDGALYVAVFGVIQGLDGVGVAKLVHD